jgi:phosphohistidine phosphatase
MRHAQAVAPPLGGDDFARALTPRGTDDARRMGHWLYSVMPTLKLVVSSPAVRAQQTTDTVTSAWPTPGPRIMWEPTLYLAELDSLLATLAWASSDPVMVIAHNPGLETLLAWLSPEAAVVNGELLPASVCVLDLVLAAGAISAGSGKLRCAMQPAQLTGA